jgi:DoxX
MVNAQGGVRVSVGGALVSCQEPHAISTKHGGIGISSAIEEGVNMLRKLVHTDHDWVLTVVRLVLGIVFFAHGAQKLLGWFGGAGFSGTMGSFTHQMGIPAPLALLAIAAEFFGGLGLIVGLLGRVAALDHLQHACGGGDGSLARRFLHELVWQSTG